MVKLPLDGCQVVKDVSVVEFEVVQDSGARAVVHKLAALVKEGGVVFVGFNDEIGAATQPGRDTKVQRYATDQKAWLQARLLQHPGQHRGGGGFAVGARHGQHVLALQDVLRQPLRAAGVRRTRFQNGLHQRKFGAAVGQSSAADHVADHVHVGFHGHLVGAKAFDQLDAQSAQLVAHGWVNARVAAGDLMTGFAGQRGQAAHEGATNAQNMYMHGWILGGHRRCLGWGGSQSMSMNDVALEIAATAARLVVEEGLAFGPAKHRALKELGLPTRTALPTNDVVEAEVRDYIALFCADTQPGELLALRELARVWMQRLAEFRPHLGGAVWQGWATRLCDVDLALFCDDPKSAEIALINQNQRYEVQTVRGLHGDDVDVLSLHSFCEPLREDVGVHLRIYDLDDLRGALLPDAQGRSPRGDLLALERLLAA